jgi:L-amino acid N-acyltransferase YncA
MAIIALAAHHESMGLFDLLGRVEWGAMPEVLAKAFSPMDLVFYGIAPYEG